MMENTWTPEIYRTNRPETDSEVPVRYRQCAAAFVAHRWTRRAAAMLEKCRRHSNPPLGARQDTRARAVSGAHRPGPGGACGCLRGCLCGCLCGFPHWRGTVLWTGCGKLPEKRAKPLIGKGVHGVAQKTGKRGGCAMRPGGAAAGGRPPPLSTAARDRTVDPLWTAF